MQLKREVRQAEPNAELFYLVTLISLKSYFSTLGFMRLPMCIVRRLRTTEGVIRYVVKTNLSRKTFQTVTVWTDPEAMRLFVRTELHCTAAARFWDLRQQRSEATVERTETDLSVGWPEINDRLKEPSFLFTRRN